MAPSQTQLSAAEAWLACPPPVASPGERFADMVQQRPELSALPPLTHVGFVTDTESLPPSAESSLLHNGDSGDRAPPQPPVAAQPAAPASDAAPAAASAVSAPDSGDAAADTDAAPEPPAPQASGRQPRLGSVSLGRRTVFSTFSGIPEHAEYHPSHPEEPLFDMGLYGMNPKRYGRQLGRSKSMGAPMHNGDGKAAAKSPRAARQAADVEAGGGPGSPGAGGGGGRGGDGNQGDTGIRSLLRMKWPHVPFYSDIGTEPWYAQTFHELTEMATPAAFATLPFALGRLTWGPGLALLVSAILMSYYCALLLAGLHSWNVIIRHCRYRDLAKSVYGTTGFNIAFICQQLGSLGNNVAIQLSSALVMKNMYEAFRPDSTISIHVCLAIFGSFELLLSQLPTLHSLRHLNGFAVFCTVSFTVLTSAQSIIDGRRSRAAGMRPSYDLEGDATSKAMAALTGTGLIAFSLANILLPEIQACVKAPAVANGKKGVSLTFAFVIVMYPLLAMAGYYGYGNGVSQLVLLNLTPQCNGIVIAVQVLLVVHSAMNFQIFARVTFEVQEYLLMDPRDGNMMSPKNCVSRLCGTFVYTLTVSFLAALLPNALADVAVIIGAACYVPLDNILPLLMYNKIRKPGAVRRWIHYAICLAWTLFAVGAIIGSVYNLASNKEFSTFFADVSVR